MNPSSSTVVVGFSPSVARSIRTQSSDDWRTFKKVLDKHQVVYEQAQWDSTDSNTSQYLFLPLAEDSNAEAVLGDLRSLPFVESAYLQPLAGQPF